MGERNRACFRRLINDAKLAVGNLVLKYVSRASVAVPFVIAVDFAVAAIAAMLGDRFTAVTGCWIWGAGRRWPLSELSPILGDGLRVRRRRYWTGGRSSAW